MHTYVCMYVCFGILLIKLSNLDFRQRFSAGNGRVDVEDVTVAGAGGAEQEPDEQRLDLGVAQRRQFLI
jgi:hypothetical protein